MRERAERSYHEQQVLAGFAQAATVGRTRAASLHLQLLRQVLNSSPGSVLRSLKSTGR
jgi:hypothetical protein